MFNQLEEGSIIIADTGNSALWLWDYPIKNKYRIITPAGYHSMGFSLPSAIAAKIAAPSKKVISLCGDGSFLMTGMEFLTAVRYNLDVTILVLHDQRYNLLNFFQDLNHKGRYTDTILHTFNFAKLANDMGGNGINISKVNEIKNALKNGIEYKGPSLIDIKIDNNSKPFFLRRLKSIKQ